MAEEIMLRRFTRRLTIQEREDILNGGRLPVGTETPIERTSGAVVDLSLVDDLMSDFEHRRADGSWSADRSTSDRWLAPRLHFALRLTRSEAGDHGLWLWLALRYESYVAWRWAGDKGIAEDRWYGPIQKQSFARLWWGGELFRNGADYTPVARAFVRQDLPNSYLHRPLVRCRSLALGLLDVVAPPGREEEVSADDVNDLARVLNLSTAGSPPEVDTGYQCDDVSAYSRWLGEPTMPVKDWSALPSGPPCQDTTARSVAGGRSVAERGWTFAHAAADARGTRSARRRGRSEQTQSKAGQITVAEPIQQR